MTQSATRDGVRFPVMGRGVKRLAATVAAISLFGVAACDTVAQIPFSDRNFSDIYPVAVHPGDVGQCGGLETNATMEMIFMDNDDEPVKLGEEVALDFVEPDRDDVDFDDSAIFTLPDVACESTDDCPGDFVCGGIDSQDSPGDRCQTATNVVESGDPVFVEDNEADSQALVAAVSEAGAWRGWPHGDLTGATPYDPETEEFGNQIQTGPVESELGVDPGLVRNQALRGMASEWDNLNDYVEDDGRDASFGFWTFAQSPGEVQPRLESDNIPWTNSSITAIDTVDDYGADGADQQRSNVYESMIQVLIGAFDDDVADALDTASAVFVVPGHDEVRVDDADDVIDTVEDIEDDYDIELDISIVQVDTSRDTDYIIDDWEYYHGEDSCQDDAECANFESCREPTWYSTDSNPADEDDVDWPQESDRGETFCLPDYDDDGRLGPIADYDRIACQTGGSYTYVPEVGRDVVQEPLDGRVWASEALWELDVTIDDRGESGEPNLLQTSIEVDIGGSESFSFDRQDDDQDRRRVFFAPSDD